MHSFRRAAIGVLAAAVLAGTLSGVEAATPAAAAPVPPSPDDPLPVTLTGGDVVA